LGVVLAGASLFAPGGRDLPSSPGPLQHPLAAILYPTVGLDALVERAPLRVGERERDEPRSSVPPVVAWAPATAALLVARAAGVLARRRPIALRRDHHVVDRRRRGPPPPARMPRARPARLLVPA
jgi:hypothetical protein